MSRADERLRKKPSEHAALEREDEAKRNQIDARVKRMEAMCLANAHSLANATGASIQVWPSRSDLAGTGFRIRIGMVHSLLARLVENNWEVTTYSQGGSRTFTYPTDQEFENAQEALLDPIIYRALEALLRGGTNPLPAGPVSSRPPVKASLIPGLWQMVRGGIGGLTVLRRRSAKRAISALATEPGPASAPFPNTHERLRKVNAQLREAHGQLEAEKARLTEGERQLRDENAQLRQAHGQLEAEKARLTEGEPQLRDENAELRQAHGRLEAEKARLTESEHQLRDENAELREMRRAWEGDKAKLAEREQQLETKNAELDDARQQLQAELVRLRATKWNLEADDAYERLKLENAQLREAHGRLEAEKAQLTESARQVQDENAQLREMRLALEGDKARLAGRQLQLESENAQLSDVQRQLQAEIVQLRSTQQELEVEKERLSEAQQQLKTDNARLTELQRKFDDQPGQFREASPRLPEGRRAERPVARVGAWRSSVKAIAAFATRLNLSRVAATRTARRDDPACSTSEEVEALVRERLQHIGELSGRATEHGLPIVGGGGADESEALA